MDDQERKRVFSRIPYGLYVVGVRQGDRLSAFTATWLSQCSFKPLRLSLAVRGGSESHPMIESDRVFSVNFLARDQIDIAKSFFKKPEQADGTLGGHPFRTGVTGCPLLTDAPAYLDCKVVEVIDAGDHTIMIGEVVDGGCTSEAEPLRLSDTPWSYDR